MKERPITYGKNPPWQGFAAGDHAAGYDLHSVGIVLDQNGFDTASETLTLSVYSSNSDGTANALVHSLTTPWSSGQDIPEDRTVYFTAPDGATLDAGTGYHLVVHGSGNASADANAGLTQANGQSGEAGWTIEDAYRRNGTPDSQGNSFRIVVRGSERPDTGAPGVTSVERQSPSSSPTNADSLTWRVTFDENVKDVDAADFEVSGTTATLAVSEVTASTVYDVTASGGDLASLDATVTLSFAGGQNIKDTSDNALTNTAPSGTNEPDYVVDNAAPTVTSIARQDPSSSPTNADSLTWRVTFGEDVTGVDAADFAVGGTTATLGVNEVTASTVYDVTASGGDLASLDATATLSFASGQNIKDLAGNALAATAPTGTNEPGYAVDNTAPTLSSASVNGTALVLTFGEDLAAASGLANGAFTVKRTRAGSEGTVSLSGSPSLSGATVTLTLAAAIAATDTDVKVSYAKPGSGTDNRLKDAAGNEVADFTDQPVSTTNAAPTAADSEVTATESTDHAFDAGDFGYADANGDTLASVKVTSLPGAGLGQLVLDGTVIASTHLPQTVTKAQIDADELLYRPVNGQFGNDLASFTFRVNDGTEDSVSAYTMTVDVDPASGHEVLVSNLGQTVSTSSYQVGNASGKTATQGFAAGDHAAGYDLHSVGIVLDQNGFDTASETLTLSVYSSNSDGTANALVHSLTTPWSSGQDIPEDRTVYFTAPDGATLDAGTGYHLVVHGSGNASADANAGLTQANGQSGEAGWTIEDAYRRNGTPDSQGNSFRIVVRGSERPDTGAPGVTSVERQSPSSSPTNADSLTWRVTFDENVKDVDAADFEVSGTTATLAVSEVTASTVYDVTASGGDLASLDATVTLSFAGGQNIKDTSDNALTNTAPSGTNEPDYVVDNAAPTVTSIARQDPSSSPTNADSLTWRVTFGEDVTGVDAADFAVGGTTATLGVNEVTASTVYDVTASGGDLASLDATATLSFASGQNIKDLAGNALAATAPTGTNEPGYAVDNTAPTLSSASVNGTALVLTFGEDLAAASGLANGAFTVKRTRAGSEGTVSLSGSPSLSGATVTLTLAAAIAATDTDVKVSYAKPGSGTDNRLKDAAGNEVADFTDQPVSTTNAAPTAADSEVTATESTDHAFTADHFGYADANGDTLASVKVTSLPGTGLGSLVLDGSTIASADLPQAVTKAQLDAGELVYRPVAGQFGNDLASFMFKVNDGTEDSADAYTMTVDVDAASGHEVLVSNMSLASAGGYVVGSATGKGATQGFAAGDHAAGYDLHSVGIVLTRNEFSASETLALFVYSSNSDGTANAEVHALTTPWSASRDIPTDGIVYFTAPDGATLDAGTGYHLVFQGTGNSGNDARASYASGDGQTGGTGWTIEDALRSDGTPNPSGNSFRIVVRGSERPDTGAPGVTSVARQSPSSSPTNADSLTWRVTFDENVKDVDAADFEVSGTTATLAVSEVTASTVYDVTASGGDLAGLDATVTLSFASGQDVADLAGNALAATAPSGTNEPDYAVDNTAPTLSSASVNGTALVLTFGEDLAAASGLANGAFTVKRTRAGSEGTVSLSGSPSLSGATVTLTLAAAIAATDTDVKVSYAKPGSGTDNRLKDAAGNEVADFTDQPVSTTNLPPTVANGLVDQRATVGADFTYQFAANSFSDANGDNLAYSAVESGESGLPSWLGFTPSTRTFAGRPGDGDVGTVTVVVTADDGRGGTISDAFEIEVSVAGALVLNVAAITGDDTVGIAEKAAGFAIAGDTGTEEDVAVTVEIGTATLTATSADPDSTDADDTATWSVDVPPDSAYIAGTGVEVTVSASKAGFTSPADEVRTLAVDLVAPTVAISGVPPTSGAPFTATFTFSEPVHGFAAEDVAVGNGTASAFSGTDGDRTYSALVTPAVDGTVTVDVAAGTAADAAGNGNLAAVQAASVYSVSAAPSVLSVTVSPVPPEAGKVGETRCTKAWLDALPAEAVHGPGATLVFTLTLDRDVTVTLAQVPDGEEEVRPELLLDVFDRERRAEYTGPVGTPVRALAFEWTVRRGDHDPDGIRVTGIALNGATARSTGGADLSPGSVPAQDFEAHRVRGGYFAVSLDLEAMEEEAREGEPFAFRVTRDGGFGEGATVFVHVDDGDAARGRTLAVEIPPEGRPLLGGGVADGRFGEGRVTPAADGRVNAARTLGLRLVRGESGCTGSEPQPAWYDVGEPASATVPVADAGIAPSADGARLLVGPASAGERDAGRVPMTFRVCLWTGSLCPDAGRNAAFEAYGGLGHEVRVDYATRDGTAKAGDDYVATSGTLVFAPGETVRTVDVEVLPDAHDEGRETVWLDLSGATGAAIGRGRNFGYIFNDGAIPRAWVARFGRTLAEQGVEAVLDRLSAGRAPGFRGRLAGQALPSGAGAEPAWRDGAEEDGEGADAADGDGTGPADADGTATDSMETDSPETDSPETGGESVEEGTGDDAFALPGFTEEERRAFTALLALETGAAPEEEEEGRALTAEDFLLGTDFDLVPGTGGGPSLGLWGRAARSGFRGREEGLALDGEATTLLLGSDWKRRDALFGLMLFRSRGEGSYAGPGGGGTVGTDLAGLVPYAGRTARGRPALWGAAGTGRGELTLTPAGQDPIAAGLDWSMAAAGAEGAPVTVDALGGARAGWRADALLTRTASEAVEGLAAATGTTTRLRLGMEASWRHDLASGGVLSPRLEAGLRHDGGDAETGFGLEAGGGVRLDDPARGLSVSVDGRALALHEDGDFEDWGLSLALEWDPRPETRTGPSVIAARSYGGASSGGVEALLDPETVPGAGRASGGAGSLDLEVAWGTAVPDWRHGAVGVAYGRVSGSPEVDGLRLGWRIGPDSGRDGGPDHDFWVDPGPRGAAAAAGAGLRWNRERAGIRSSTGIDLRTSEGGGLEAGLALAWEW